MKSEFARKYKKKLLALWPEISIKIDNENWFQAAASENTENTELPKNTKKQIV